MVSRKVFFLEHVIAKLESKNVDLDFVLVVGDDSSDEPMFEALQFLNTTKKSPCNAYSVTVGKKPTAAKAYLDDPNAVLEFLAVLRRSTLREAGRDDAILQVQLNADSFDLSGEDSSVWRDSGAIISPLTSPPKPTSALKDSPSHSNISPVYAQVAAISKQQFGSHGKLSSASNRSFNRLEIEKTAYRASQVNLTNLGTSVYLASVDPTEQMDGIDEDAEIISSGKPETEEEEEDNFF